MPDMPQPYSGRSGRSAACRSAGPPAARSPQFAAKPTPYDQIGVGYARVRRPDPRLAAVICQALGDARNVVNIGAGAGSYEPRGARVVAVEPSQVMLSQHPGRHRVRARAEKLPFPDRTFDAAMAVMTVHHQPAFWRRPCAYLDARVRGASSTSAQLPDSVVRPAMERLAADLESGAWAERHRDLLGEAAVDYGYRLVVSG